MDAVIFAQRLKIISLYKDIIIALNENIALREEIMKLDEISKGLDEISKGLEEVSKGPVSSKK